MKRIFFIALFFISYKGFGQALPYNPATTRQGSVLSLSNDRSQFLSGTDQWLTPTTQGIFDFLDYGGVPDGQYGRHASATSGSAIITCASCTFTTTAHTGQAFRMDSAGASGKGLVTTILSVTDNTHIVLNTTAGTSVGSKLIIWGTDNTAAFINFLDTVYVHGGGEAYVPTGIYVMAGPLITSYDGANPNCQIPLPVGGVGDTSWQHRTGIRIRGAAIPNFVQASYAYDSCPSFTGTVIHSIIDGTMSSDSIAPAIFGTKAPNAPGGVYGINYNFFQWQDLSIFVPQNAGAGGGPAIGGINCYYCGAPQTQNVNITMNGSLLSSSQPTNNVAGFITNQYASELVTLVMNTQIVGFKYALVPSDHATLIKYEAYGDYYAVVLGKNAYPVNGYIGDQECAVGIYVPSTTFLGNIVGGASCSANIQTWQIESPIAGQWFSRVADFIDSSNVCTGQASYFANGAAQEITRYPTGAQNQQFLLTPLGEYGNEIGLYQRVLLMGNALAKSSQFQANSDSSGIIPGLILNNSYSGSGAGEGILIGSNLGYSSHGLSVAVLSSTAGSPFNSAARIYNYDGPLYFGATATRIGYAGSTGWQFATNAIAPVATALVDVNSTTQGMLFPNLTTTQQNAISSPATSLWIYNTDSNLYRYYYSGAWHSVGGSSGGGGGAGMAIGGAITSATAGSALYAGTSGLLQQSNGTYFYDSTNNRLGIGTNAPSSGFHLKQSNGSAGTTQARIENTSSSGDAQVQIKNDAGHLLQLYTLGSAYVTSGILVADNAYINSTAGQGLNIVQTVASKNINFYVGGNTSTNLFVTMQPSNLLIGTNTAVRTVTISDAAASTATGLEIVSGGTTSTSIAAMELKNNNGDKAQHYMTNSTYTPTGNQLASQYNLNTFGAGGQIHQIFNTTGDFQIASGSASAPTVYFDLKPNGNTIFSIPGAAFLQQKNGLADFGSTVGVTGAYSWKLGFLTNGTSQTNGAGIQMDSSNNVIMGNSTNSYVQLTGGLAISGEVAITSGTSSTVAANITNVYINPASLISTYTLTLPAAPVDGQIIQIFGGGTIAGNSVVVTSFTVSANSGQSLEQTAAPTTILGGNCFIYQYRANNTIWYRKQ